MLSAFGFSSVSIAKKRRVKRACSAGRRARNAPRARLARNWKPVSKPLTHEAAPAILDQHSLLCACDGLPRLSSRGVSFQTFSSFTLGLRADYARGGTNNGSAAMTGPTLTESQRMAVDALKSDAHVFLNAPRREGRSFLAAVAVAEMAAELNGITVRDALTGQSYFVPPGTPWQEALLARETL